MDIKFIKITHKQHTLNNYKYKKQHDVVDKIAKNEKNKLRRYKNEIKNYSR